MAKRMMVVPAEANRVNTMLTNFNIGENYRLVRKAEFAARLGLSLAQFSKLVRSGKIIPPLTKFGRSPRWCLGTIDRWISEGCPDAVFFRWSNKSESKVK